MAVPEKCVCLKRVLYLSGRGDFTEESACRMMNSYKELATNKWDLNETLPWVFLGETSDNHNYSYLGIADELRTIYLLNTGIKRYRNSSLFDKFLCFTVPSLTYCMVQRPSWETNWFAVSQEVSHISRSPEVYYRTHKRPPPFSILGQPNPVRIPTSHLLEIHPNIIHPLTPRTPHWSLSPRFPHQDPIHSPLLTHTRHMPSPSHSSRFYHPHDIG